MRPAKAVAANALQLLGTTKRRVVMAEEKLRSPTNTLLRSSEQFQKQQAKLVPDLTSGRANVPHLDTPTAFDGRRVWAAYLPPIKDQCQCGGCYAFATNSCLAARINLWTRNYVHVDLSPAKMILCNWGGDAEHDIVSAAFRESLDFDVVRKDIAKAVRRVGCSGETLIGAWQYLYRYGGVSEACHPYTHGEHNLCKLSVGAELPTCRAISGPNLDECMDGSAERQYRAGGMYYVTRDSMDATVDAIQQEIYKFGPVTTGMEVYDDLWDYKPGEVYRHNGRAPLSGGHAVMLTGWGVARDGTPYWQVFNSWGAQWGDRGYFNILRGANHCEIEANVVTGYPDMFLADEFLLNQRLTTSQDMFLRGVWQQDPSGYNVGRIDEMISGQRAPQLLTFTFPPRLIPNYATMVAGKPATITFPFAVEDVQWGLYIFTMTAALALLSLLMLQ